MSDLSDLSDRSDKIRKLLTLYEFYRLFAGKVFNAHFEHCATREAACYFLGQALGIVGIATLPQYFKSRHFFGIILDNPDGAEGYRAAEICGVGLGMDFVLRNHRKARIAVLCKQINLMPIEGGVKIQLSIVIDMAQRNAIGLHVFSAQRQHSGRAVAEYFNALLRGQLLFEAAHFSFHQCMNFSPVIEIIRVAMKNNRQNVAGSLKKMIPTTTVPTAPIPVHTG